MINGKNPFPRCDIGDKDMIERQKSRNYKLEPDVVERTSKPLRLLIDLLLEPDPALRLDADGICDTPWFPVVYREMEIYLSKPTPQPQNANSHETKAKPQQ